MKHCLVNHQQICVNKTQNRTTLKIEAGYYLEFVILKTVKVLKRIESRRTKHNNDENVLQLEITEVVLLHCNIINNQYQHDSRVLCKFVANIVFA